MNASLKIVLDNLDTENPAKLSLLRLCKSLQSTKVTMEKARFLLQPGSEGWNALCQVEREILGIIGDKHLF